MKVDSIAHRTLVVLAGWMVAIATKDVSAADGECPCLQNVTKATPAIAGEIQSYTLTVNRELIADAGPSDGLNLEGAGDRVEIDVETWGWGLVTFQARDCCIKGDILSVRGPLGTKSGGTVKYMLGSLAFRGAPVRHRFSVSFKSCPNGYPAGFYFGATFKPLFSPQVQKTIDNAYDLVVSLIEKKN